MSITYPRTDLPGGHGDDEVPDAELLERARSGDRGAVDLLVSRHLGTVRAVCRSRLRSPHDVNDAIQETFLRALPRLAEVRDADRVGAWLRAIAVRVCLDHHRATARTVAQPTPGANHADLGRGPEENAIGRDAARTLHARLASLSDRDARALWLRDAHGAGVPEVARDLGLTEGSARVLLTRARHRLRATYQGLAGLAGVGWLRFRQRIADLLGPTGLDGRSAAVAAVAQATLAAAIVMTVIPGTGDEAPAAPTGPQPAAEQTVLSLPAPSGPTVALPSPVPPAAPSPSASASGPAPREPEPSAAPDLRAGPVVVTEETPSQEPAARVEAGEQGELAQALVYAGNLVTGDEPSDSSSSSSSGSEEPADDETDEDDDEDLTLGRGLVRELIGGVQP